MCRRKEKRLQTHFLYMLVKRIIEKRSVEFPWPSFWLPLEAGLKRCWGLKKISVRFGAKFKAAACAGEDTETTGAVLGSSRIGKLASRYGPSLVSLRSTTIYHKSTQSSCKPQPIGLDMNLKITTSIMLCQSHDVSGIDTQIGNDSAYQDTTIL